MSRAYIPPDDMESVQPLLIGAQIPDVTLFDLEGQSVSIRAIVAQSPTVMVFYRGHW